MSSEKQFNPETGELEVKKINFDPLLKAAHIDDIEPDAGPTFGKFAIFCQTVDILIGKLLTQENLNFWRFLTF